MNPFDKNFNAHIATIPSRINGMIVRKKPNITYVDSGIHSETFNIIHITNGHHISAHEIQSAVDHFETADRPFTFWIGKNQLNETVKSILGNLNLIQLQSSPGMRLDLENNTMTYKFEPSTIKLAITKEDIRIYSALLADLWTPADPDIDSYYDRATKTILEKSLPVKYALYYHQEIAVAGLEMCITDQEVMGVYGLVTAKPLRALGIGTALMNFALAHAQEHHLKSVVLLASNMGLTLYKSLGFKTVTQYYEYGFEPN
jgi:GNAT superfamily N-acetyltransferase